MSRCHFSSENREQKYSKGMKFALALLVGLTVFSCAPKGPPAPSDGESERSAVSRDVGPPAPPESPAVEAPPGESRETAPDGSPGKTRNAPSVQRTEPDLYPRPVEREGVPPFGLKLTLREFLERCLLNQYFPPENIYTPPPEEFTGRYYIRLSNENAVLHLAEGVTDYAADDSGLAVAVSDGIIRIYSDWACPSVAARSRTIPDMSWHSTSPMLAALEADRRTARVWDLRHCAEAAVHSVEGVISGMALSPRGTWLALVDEGHNLHIGPAAGRLEKAARLRYDVLSLMFSPAEGLLVAVDQGGWVTVWASRTRELVYKFPVQGAPFQAAELRGRMLDIVAEDGRRMTWDLVSREQVSPEKPESPFRLKDGVLTYRTWGKQFVKKVLFGSPSPVLRYSREHGLLRLEDLDGKVRFFNRNTGDQAPPPPQRASDPGDPVDPREESGWELARLDADYRVRIDGTEYAVADRVFTRDGRTLWCRFVNGAGYYLWWKESSFRSDTEPRPGSLPVRDNLRADIPATWHAWNSPQTLP